MKKFADKFYQMLSLIMIALGSCIMTCALVYCLIPEIRMTVENWQLRVIIGCVFGLVMITIAVWHELTNGVEEVNGHFYTNNGEDVLCILTDYYDDGTDEKYLGWRKAAEVED